MRALFDVNVLPAPSDARHPHHARVQGWRKSGTRLLALLTGRADREFRPNDVSLLDVAVVDHSRVLSRKTLTDVYLLALAVKHVGRLVTLDTGIDYRAARGARANQLVVI